MALVCAASVSAPTLPLHAQTPEPDPNAPESDAPPASAGDPSTEGGSPSEADDPSSAGAATSDAPGGATEAPPTETTPTIETTPTETTPTETTPTEVTPTDVPPTDTAASPAAPSAASAHRLAPPIAPPPPPVGFDDERAAPPTEEPRPRSALRERFVIFSPGWMPIVTLGYRAQIVRYTGGTVDQSDTSHGLTSGVLAPVLATGDSSSRVRLALGVGMGLDVAWRSAPSASTPFPDDVVVGGAPVSPGSRARYVERTTYVYGQLAAMLVVPIGSARALATLSWLPGKRFVTGEFGSGWPTLERARFSVGVLRVPLQVSAFTGVARIDTAADVELGLQLGMGW
jgi:hypothetical protein